MWVYLLGAITACDADPSKKPSPPTESSPEDSGPTDTSPLDADDDGITTPADCDDNNAEVYPGAQEICGDGIDNDCADTGCGLTGDHSTQDAQAFIVGNSRGEGMGNTVFWAGDTNADGFDDLVVSSNGSAPMSYLFNGPFQSTLTASNAQASLPNLVLMPAGDLNSDGQADLWAGDAEGALYLLFAPFEGGLCQPDCNSVAQGQVILDDGPSYDGPAVVIPAGDPDQDGLPDTWLAYAHFGWGGEGFPSQAGATFFLPGAAMGNLSPNPLSDPGVIGLENSDQMLVLGAGDDIDGDGIDDLLLGSFHSNNMVGGAWLFTHLPQGQESPADADAVLTGDGIGASGSFAGDLNLDGYPDMVLGSLNAEIWVVGGPLGSDWLLSHAFASVESPNCREATSPLHAYRAGDVDGDQQADLLLSCPVDTTAGDNAGASYLMYGPLSGHHSTQDLPDHILGVAYDYSASAVATDVDADQDGYSDIVLGSPWDNNFGLNYGAVYYFSGISRQ